MARHPAAPARGIEFSVAGTPVRIEPVFLVVVALLGVDPTDPAPLRIATWLVVVTASILVHELGHAVAFRAFGRRPRITLTGFGGLTAAEGALAPGRSVVVSLAGPLSALLLLGLPALWLARSGMVASEPVAVVIGQLVWVNLGWSLLNLLPVLPLDGGHVCEAVADRLTGGRGRRVARLVSIGVAAVAGVVALRAGLVSAAVLAAMLAGLNATELSRVKQAELAARLRDALRLLLAGRDAEAEAVARQVLARRPSGETLASAAELAGWARLRQGDPAGARAVIDRAAHAGAPSRYFEAADALATGRVGEGVAVLAWALAHEPRGPSAGPGPMAALGALAAAEAGQAVAVARELVLVDPGGPEAARAFAALLEAAGRPVEARQVARALAPGS